MSNIQNNQVKLLNDHNEDITIGDSGSILIVHTAAAPRVISLPDAAPGINYRFIVGGANGVALGNTVTLTPPGSFYGVAIGAAAGAGVSVAYANAGTVVLTAAALAGDFVDLICDGIAWNVSGMGVDVSFA